MPNPVQAAWGRLRPAFTAPWSGNHRLGLGLIIASALVASVNGVSQGVQNTG